jgi:hypothetical protein
MPGLLTSLMRERIRDNWATRCVVDARSNDIGVEADGLRDCRDNIEQMGLAQVHIKIFELRGPIACENRFYASPDGPALAGGLACSPPIFLSARRCQAPRALNASDRNTRTGHLAGPDEDNPAPDNIKNANPVPLRQFGPSPRGQANDDPGPCSGRRACGGADGGAHVVVQPVAHLLGEHRCVGSRWSRLAAARNRAGDHHLVGHLFVPRVEQRHAD